MFKFVGCCAIRCSFAVVCKGKTSRRASLTSFGRCCSLQARNLCFQVARMHQVDGQDTWRVVGFYQLEPFAEIEVS